MDITKPVGLFEEEPRVTYCKCDLSKDFAVRDSVMPVLKPFLKQRNVILVNNAGCHSSALVADEKVQANNHGALVRRTFNVNFFAAIDLIECMFEHLDHVVNIASVLSALGLPALSDYSSSKAALTAYHESLYFEIRKRQVCI